MVGAVGGMTHESMTAMMRAMLILAVPACVVVSGIAVMAYRRWKDDISQQ
jgi:hypothetical protein